MRLLRENVEEAGGYRSLEVGEEIKVGVITMGIPVAQKNLTCTQNCGTV